MYIPKLDLAGIYRWLLLEEDYTQKIVYIMYMHLVEVAKVEVAKAIVRT